MRRIKECDNMTKRFEGPESYAGTRDNERKCISTVTVSTYDGRFRVRKNDVRGGWLLMTVSVPGSVLLG